MKDTKPTQHKEITTSSQRQFKTSIPQGGVLSTTLFNIYTADIPPPRAPVQVMTYTDDITSSHLHTQAQLQPRNTYNHTYIKFLPGQNKIISELNPAGKTTYTLFTPAEHKSNLDLKINYTTHGKAPKGSGPYLIPKTHIQHTYPQTSQYNHTSHYK